MKTYTIGVLADTHVPEYAPALPAQIVEAFAGVDLILHAGDVTGSGVLRELSHVAPVLAVRGDHDDLDLPRRLIIPIGGVTIALTHGSRPIYRELPETLGNNQNAERRRRSWDRFLNDTVRSFGAVDAIIFGHAHRAYMARHDGILLFCPGAVFHRTLDSTRAELAQNPPLPHRLYLERWLEKAAKEGDRPAVPPTLGILTLAAGRLRAEVVSLPGTEQ